MLYLLSFFSIVLVVALIGVASNPSPYFAALGLVVVAGMGCGVLGGYGGSFLSLILFLIYLGGMMVVFAYSAALAAEPYPEGSLFKLVLVPAVMYVVVATFSGCVYMDGPVVSGLLPAGEADDFSLYRGDIGGVALMYSAGGGMLAASAWVLLLTLIVVLELTRGLGRGALRAV
uniref:NADH-ubiquinone oxidoreductase chain 6 n=1 Tax=Pyronotanthias smithvanizi TaxID=3363808 RepID=A0AAU6QEE5_9TELE